MLNFHTATQIPFRVWKSLKRVSRISCLAFTGDTTPKLAINRKPASIPSTFTTAYKRKGWVEDKYILEDKYENPFVTSVLEVNIWPQRFIPMMINCSEGYCWHYDHSIPLGLKGS